MTSEFAVKAGPELFNDIIPVKKVPDRRILSVFKCMDYQQRFVFQGPQHRLISFGLCVISDISPYALGISVLYNVAYFPVKIDRGKRGAPFFLIKIEYLARQSQSSEKRSGKQEIDPVNVRGCT